MKKKIAIYEWEKFCQYLTQKNRYILSPRWKKFTDEILNWATKREQIFTKDTPFWRARIGSIVKKVTNDTKISPLTDKSMGAPSHGDAQEGRANPVGIPYLYLACDEETAISEVKPYLSKHVTLATFKLVREVKLVNASNEPLNFNFALSIGKKSQISPEDREKWIWAYINTYFSIPIAPEDKHCDYIPTQYLAELFKNGKYDGIMYKSAMQEDGYNIVLFDAKAASVVNKKVINIHKILYEHKEVAI